ncbi:hypothetical protein D3C80_2005220 [compost metagenome]
MLSGNASQSGRPPHLTCPAARYGELLPAIPGCQPAGFLHLLLQNVSDLLKTQVPRLMTIYIIESLKIINIEQD